MAYLHAPKSMTPGPVVFDPQGTDLLPEERDMLAHPHVGGVILFRHNYHDAAQLRELIRACRSAHQGPLLIMVDHEGGRVQRFRSGFSALPPAAALGVQYRTDSVAACTTARSLGQLMAHELVRVGIDINLAPVLDIAGDGTVIGDRALSSDPDTVTALGRAIVMGMHDGSLGAAAKHFPGHGGVVEDTHTESAVDHRDLAAIRDRDGRPFKGLIDAGVDGVLPAHVCFPEIEDAPVGYSTRWLQDELRFEFGFKGLIISDDISMAAAARPGGVVSAAQDALGAGCDFVLSCQKPDAAESLLDGLQEAGDTVQRASRCADFDLRRRERQSAFDPQVAAERVGHLRRVWEDCTA